MFRIFNKETSHLVSRKRPHGINAPFRTIQNNPVIRSQRQNGLKYLGLGPLLGVIGFFLWDKKDHGEAEENRIEADDAVKSHPIKNLFLQEMSINRTQGKQHVVRNLTIKGGGTKGAAYPSALKQLSDELGGLGNIERISGASAGSIVAALMAVGYSPDKIEEFLQEKDEKNRPLLLRLALDGDDAISDKFVEKLIATASNARYPKIQIPWLMLRYPFQFWQFSRKYYRQKGLCRGEFFEIWLNEKIREKMIWRILADKKNTLSEAALRREYEWPTFGQLNALVERYGYQDFKHLYVSTAELVLDNPGKAAHCVYSSEPLLELAAHTKEIKYQSDLIIARTIRSSMSIPLFFTPIPLEAWDAQSGEKITLSDSLTVDGGVLENYPVTVFDYNIFHRFPHSELLPHDKLINPETVGLFLFSQKEFSTPRWLWHQVRLLLNMTDTLYPENNPARIIKPKLLPEDAFHRHIMIDSCGVQLTDFDLDKSKLAALKASGRNGVMSYIKKDMSTLHEEHETQLAEKNRAFENQIKRFESHTNISNYPVRDDYQEPQQYLKMLTEIDGELIKNKNKKITLSIEGFGGTGKTELARYVAYRYLEACFWAQWRENKLDASVSTLPVVWFFDAENPKQMLSSFIDLARNLQIGVKEDLLQPIEGEGLFQQKDRIRRAIKHYINEMHRIIKNNPSVLWIFDNANAFEKNDTVVYPDLETYWHAIPSVPWRLMTTRDRALLPASHYVDMDKGIGEKAARALIESITSLPDSDALARELHYLPLSLIIAGRYIREQRRYDVNFGYQEYLEEYKIQAKRFLKETGRLAEGATQEIILKQSIARVKQISEETFQVLQFCSLLYPDAIPDDLLISFIRKQQPDLNEVSELIKNSLDQTFSLLSKYSLLKRVQTNDKQQKNYAIHRLTQDVAINQFELINQTDALIIGAIMDYCLQQETKENNNKITFKPSLNLMRHLDAIAHYYKKNKNQNIIYANLFGKLAAYYFDLGDAHKEKVFLERALAIKETHYGKDHYQVAMTLANLGNAYGALGDPQKKKACLERALAIKETHYGKDHYQVAMTLANLGNAYGDLGDPQKKKALLERALPILETHYGKDHYQVAMTLVNLGNAYGDLGDPQKQKALLERALPILETHYGKDHYQVAMTLANLGNAYGDLGDPQKQKACLERALAIEETHYGKDHYQVAMTLVNLGNAYGALGDPQKKKACLERALAIEETHYGKDHYQVAMTLANLGNAYGALGDPQKQKDLLERALAIKETHYGKDHYQVAMTLANLGNAYGALGDPQKQKDLLERALAIKETHYGKDHYQVAMTLVNLGNAYGDLGDPQKQKDLLERAFPILETHYGKDHPYTKIVRGNLEKTNGMIDPENAYSQPEVRPGSW